MPDSDHNIGLRTAARLGLRTRKVLGLIGVYLAMYLLVDAGALVHEYLLLPEGVSHVNPNVAEGAAWLAGRLELADRTYDTAQYEGRAYNVFPPLFSLISAAVLAFVPAGVPHVVLLVVAALPIPGLAYGLFLRRTRRVRMAVLLTLGYLLGTSLLPVMDYALRNGDVWHVNHLLSQVGLLIFLGDYFGRRRIWLGGLGLILAIWSRQLMAWYLLPLALVAWRLRVSSSRRRAVWGFVIPAVVALVLPALLNTLKFDSPLASGYRHIYEGRWDNLDDWPAQSARRGIFSPVFLPRNLYFMNLGLPLPDLRGWALRFRPDVRGTGIWWTTPLLLLLVYDWHRVRRRREVRYLLTAVAGCWAVLMLYHSTGYAQLGYNRFSLDFMVVLLAVVAPRCDGPRRRWMALACVLWSIWYFRWAI
ncbi:MAG: hypothetical protein IID40_00645 [Planctomycetes bacterium]|nr:hypothetical protein [Planctomycetota bacterium]